MDILTFVIYALIASIMLLMVGGTLIGYFLQKKYEYEMKKLSVLGNAVRQNALNNLKKSD